jgi:hypothetical protein
MARPIEATPVLTGHDARVFLRETEVREPVSAERLSWLDNLAQQSKSAETKTK